MATTNVVLILLICLRSGLAMVSGPRPIGTSDTSVKTGRAVLGNGMDLNLVANQMMQLLSTRVAAPQIDLIPALINMVPVDLIQAFLATAIGSVLSTAVLPLMTKGRIMTAILVVALLTGLLATSTFNTTLQSLGLPIVDLSAVWNSITNLLDNVDQASLSRMATTVGIPQAYIALLGENCRLRTVCEIGEHLGNTFPVVTTLLQYLDGTTLASQAYVRSFIDGLKFGSCSNISTCRFSPLRHLLSITSGL